MKKKKTIPVNSFNDKYREGIIIARASLNGLPNSKEIEQSHRDEGHLFILQEKGTTYIEIDFQKHKIKAPALIYIHPNQVHRLINFENATVGTWMITSENLHQEYITLLEDLTPVKFLSLKKEPLSIISEMLSLCITLSERKDEKLYYSILKESCNTLVTLVISQYLSLSKSTDQISRFTVITKAFKLSLEQNYIEIKSPAEYAKNLNISTAYLNECVKTTTGHPVSYHIQQRVILESQRLLYHSDKSIKEIASELGYDDYSYFTRLFTKVTGMTPLAFRNKNLD
ncbi:helix-turn-helix domain-containing protein [Flavobacterium granuli]|uniref:AraC-like DNA-binding protein n=1 Tax=Flavobacterium granuli TaxID=280093 RepID=A0ABU1S624_9FLAO|nr:helix-turn-helix domain-containing protein [Flavobacterium granuli]MDR6846105.1 AraC-like DNA-binding protein [Flavobacterium granuli]